MLLLLTRRFVRTLGSARELLLLIGVPAVSPGLVLGIAWAVVCTLS